MAINHEERKASIAKEKISLFIKTYKEMKNQELVWFIDRYGQSDFFLDLRLVFENDFRNETWTQEYVEISTAYYKAKHYFATH